MSIVNALFGAKQAKQQAQAIERSTDRATDVQMQMFNKQQPMGQQENHDHIHQCQQYIFRTLNEVHHQISSNLYELVISLHFFLS